MPVFEVARFEVRPDAREEAERAMHEVASQIRRDLPNTFCAAYREAGAPNRYIAFFRRGDDEGTDAFVEALAPLAAGSVDVTRYELVTSTDLAPRHRDGGSARQRRRLGR